MSVRGVNIQTIPSHPIVVYHPYTWEHYKHYNNNHSFLCSNALRGTTPYSKLIIKRLRHIPCWTGWPWPGHGRCPGRQVGRISALSCHRSASHTNTGAGLAVVFMYFYYGWQSVEILGRIRILTKIRQKYGQISDSWIFGGLRIFEL